MGLLLHSFSWGHALRTEYFDISKWSLFSFPCRSIRDFFLWGYGSLVELLKVNFTILWKLPYNSVPWSFISQNCSHWASSNSSFIVQVFLSWHCFLWSLLYRVSAFISCDSSRMPFCVSNLGSSTFFEGPFLSYQSNKNCWLFVLFSFSLVVKIEWLILSFSELETRSLIS